MHPKTHIARGDGTTWTLCGRYLMTDNIVEADDKATCLRCLKYYAKRKPLSGGGRIAAMTHGVKWDKKEIRTISSTGGQKGVKEARFDLIPVESLTDLAVLFGRGARKYEVHQWRNGYEWGKSYSALQRHANAWQSGLDFDVCSNEPEGCQYVDAEGNLFVPPAPDTCYNHTGAHHMIAVAWHAFVLREFSRTHPDHDNRYIIKE